MSILRASVDRGAAVDMAGKGVASAVGMIEAVIPAAKYSPGFTALYAAFAG